MKTAVVVNCLEMGGMERVAVNLADAFAKEGHDSHLIYLKDRNIEVSPNQNSVNLHLFHLSKIVMYSGLGIIWLIVCRLLNIIFRKTYPIFMAYAESVAFSYKLSKLEKKHGRFDLIVFRGQGTFTHIWPLKDPRFVFVCESVQKPLQYKSLSSFVFNSLFKNRKVVCVSNGAKQSFEQLTTLHNIQCESIHMITNPNDFQVIKNQSLHSTSSYFERYILGLGRLVPLKNFSLLIEAYSYAREHYNLTLPLVIVGEGKDRKALESLVEQRGLNEYVFFQGQVSNPYPWFKGAELFVLSSKSEGLGMVLIEALLCGCKLVTTDCPGGVTDIMKGPLENFRVSQTPEALAKAMHHALSLNGPQISDDERVGILSPFSGEVIVQQYMNNFVNNLRS